MPDEVKHIRGDTFTVVGQFGPADFTGYTGKSQVRSWDTDLLYSELNFQWADITIGTFSVEVLATQNWPAGKYVGFDVQIRSPQGRIVSCPRVKILVETDVTHD